MAVSTRDSLLCTHFLGHDPHRWQSLFTGVFYRCEGNPATSPAFVAVRGMRLPCSECGEVQLIVGDGVVRAHPPQRPHCAGSGLPPAIEVA